MYCMHTNKKHQNILNILGRNNMINEFKKFMEHEEQKNVESMISKLPRSHQKLLDGYKFKYTPRNTLKGDNNHIGYIHQDKIVVAAPWNYSREFTTLHECAHLIFEKLMTPKLKKKWSDLVKKTISDQIKNNHSSKSALKQNDEEIFCMVYAATYAKHPPKTYVNKEWQDFINHKVPQ